MKVTFLCVIGLATAALLGGCGSGETIDEKDSISATLDAAKQKGGEKAGETSRTLKKTGDKVATPPADPPKTTG